jgi:hypothetical protein
VRNQIDLLGEFRYEIPPQEKFLAWSMIEYPRKIEATTKEVEENLEEDKVRRQGGTWPMERGECWQGSV